MDVRGSVLVGSAKPYINMCVRYSGITNRGNYHTYGHIWCAYTILANPTYTMQVNAESLGTRWGGLKIGFTFSIDHARASRGGSTKGRKSGAQELYFIGDADFPAAPGVHLYSQIRRADKQGRHAVAAAFQINNQYQVHRTLVWKNIGI